MGLRPSVILSLPLIHAINGGHIARTQAKNHQRGPDIPCFLKIEKWIITKIRVSSGKTNV